nr:hypothetical protein GCM10020092_013860 [Actinoplanes digitatis]
MGLASYFLAPGLLYDNTVRSAREAGVTAVAEPLTDVPDLVHLVVEPDSGRSGPLCRRPIRCRPLRLIRSRSL